jgi:hypothetical protein
VNVRKRSLALTLIRWCAALLPADRASWADAMRGEVDAIEEDGAALSFAAGCIWGALRARVATKAFVAQGLRVATIGGVLSLSVVSALMTKRMVDTQAPEALVFGLTSAAFAAAVWSGLRGPVVLVRTAGAILPVYILAYAFAGREELVAAGWVDAELHQALAIEGVVIWAALLTGGIIMSRLETRATSSAGESTP